jgi:methylated-DNA-protein-cysteine methyltransferase related protein
LACLDWKCLNRALTEPEMTDSGKLRKAQGRDARIARLRAHILAVIRQIPRGKVSTYGAIAKVAGMPRGARLVAKVLHGAFGLPWHRVLGAGGEIKLSGDYALDQRLRLQSEGVGFRGRHVDMTRYEFKFPKWLSSTPQTSATKTFAKKNSKGKP